MKKQRIEIAIAAKKLCRCELKRASKILEQCPDIGKKLKVLLDRTM